MCVCTSTRCHPCGVPLISSEHFTFVQKLTHSKVSYLTNRPCIILNHTISRVKTSHEETRITHDTHNSTRYKHFSHAHLHVSVFIHEHIEGFEISMNGRSVTLVESPQTLCQLVVVWVKKQVG